MILLINLQRGRGWSIKRDILLLFEDAICFVGGTVGAQYFEPVSKAGSQKLQDCD
jgi:hypothetical protein